MKVFRFSKWGANDKKWFTLSFHLFRCHMKEFYSKTLEKRLFCQSMYR